MTLFFYKLLCRDQHVAEVRTFFAGVLLTCAWTPAVFAGARTLDGDSGRRWLTFVGASGSEGIIQLITYLAFFWALSALSAQFGLIASWRKGFTLNLLKVDDERLILPEQVHALQKTIGKLGAADKASPLVMVLSRAVSRYRTARSVQETTEIVRTQVGLLTEESDSSFATIRYLAWAIPSIGFIGTVIGISQALGKVTVSTEAVTESLNTAFDTTAIALVLSLVLMFVVTRAQRTAERTLLAIEQHCLDHFINRLYDPDAEGAG